MADNAPATLAGLRILVVEDEYMISEFIGMLLEDLNHIVVGPFATVADAVTAVETNGLDGAVLDANLDGDSTSPIAEALNALSVPFIVATGYGGHSRLHDALNSAPRITKPIDQAEFAKIATATFKRNVADNMA